MLSIDQLKRSLNGEQVLTVLIARLYFNTATRQDVEDHISAHSIKWQRFAQLIKGHNIRAFVYFVVAKNTLSIPPKIQAQLKAHSAQVLRKNLSHLKATSELIKDLNASGVNAFAYKGVLFADRYYGNIALRESSDIDLLIAIKDAEKAEGHFIANGYQPKTTVPKGWMAYYKLFFKDIVYYRAGDINGSLEVHWRLVDRFSGNFPGYEYFSKHLVTYERSGFGFQQPDPDRDLLMIVSNHFVKDMGNKFKYFIDMACMLQKNGQVLDITMVNKTARQYGFVKKLATGLALTDQLLGISLPGKRYDDVDLIGLKIALQSPPALKRLYINEPEFIRRSLQLQDSLWRKAKFIARCLAYVFLPTYADLNAFRWPAFTLPFLMILRPFRLLYLMLRPNHANK